MLTGETAREQLEAAIDEQFVLQDRCFSRIHWPADFFMGQAAMNVIRHRLSKAADGSAWWPRRTVTFAARHLLADCSVCNQSRF